MGRELLMGYQDVALTAPRASFSTTFLNNCGKSLVTTTCLNNDGSGKSLVTTKCLNTVVGVDKGMLPVRYFRSSKVSFCVSLISWRSLDCHKDEVYLAIVSFGGITGYNYC